MRLCLHGLRLSLTISLPIAKAPATLPPSFFGFGLSFGLWFGLRGWLGWRGGFIRRCRHIVVITRFKPFAQASVRVIDALHTPNGLGVAVSVRVPFGCQTPIRFLDLNQASADVYAQFVVRITVKNVCRTHRSTKRMPDMEQSQHTAYRKDHGHDSVHEM